MLLSRLLSLVLAVAVAASVYSAEPPRKAEPPVQVVKLEVNAAQPPEGDNPPALASVRVHLRVNLPGKEIVGLDRASKLIAFTDDRGTDLTGGPTVPPKPGLLENAYPLIGKDRSRMTLALFSSNVTPAPRSREFRLKAELGILVGGAVEVTKATVVVVPGTEKRIGAVDLRIGGTEKAPTFTLNYIQEQFKEVTFEDTEGAPVKAILMGTTGIRDKEKNRTKTRAEYRLGERLEKVVVKVRTFEKLDTVTVPVDLAFGLGLE